MRALVAAIVFAVGGSAAPQPANLPTAGPVTLLAADGPLAAAVVAGDGKKRCTQIVLWRPGTRPATITTIVGCEPGALFGDVVELALGGKRVIWQETNGGNNLELIVNTATVAKPKPADVSYVENGNGAAGDPGGPYTGGLYADGSLSVFASWTHCDPYADQAGYADQCESGKPQVYDGALHQVVAGKDRVLRKGDDMLYPIWVDGGRILIHNGSKLMLLRTTGATLRTFDAGSGFVGAAFHGPDLVVLRQTALDVYDTGTGAITHSYHLAKAKRRLVDVQSGIAVMVVGGSVRLMKLDSGKGASVTPKGGGTIQAQLEAPGLFTSSKTGIRFEPMSKVLARFH